jgi:hypothetical protein
MSTKAQHRAKVGLPPLVFGPQWADMLRHAYVQPVLSKARQDYMNAQAQKVPILNKPYSITQDATLTTLGTLEVREALVRTSETLSVDKPKRKYARKAKVAEVNHG